MLPLNSERLVLRRFTKSDAAAFLGYRNDPEVIRYQNWNGCTAAEATEFIRRQQTQEAGVPGEWLQIAIALKATNELIGDCGVRIHGEPRSPSLDLPRDHEHAAARKATVRSAGLRPAALPMVHGEYARQASIGVSLARAWQGQGFATEALSCLYDHLFRHDALHRIMVDTDAENTAMQKLAVRLGMRHEAHLRQSLWFKGRWTDEYYYAILRDEWLAAKRPAEGGTS